MQRQAERYGISDVALAKTCRRHIIPVPARGYWRRKEIGRAPERPPLPRPRPGAPDTLTFTRARRPAPPPRSPDISTRQAYESLPENRIHVAGDRGGQGHRRLRVERLAGVGSPACGPG
jgi:hypothetical protein